MNKQEFLAELQKGLSGLPQEDRDERLTFYGEMLDDRMEEGLSEEEAVAAVGSVEEIVRQTAADIPLAKIARERIRPKRRLMNRTPFVRQCGIMSNKWGDYLCQREYQTNDTRRNSRNWSWKPCKRKS